MNMTTRRGFLLIGSIVSLLIFVQPAVAQTPTPTGTRGGRFGERIPTIQQRFTDKITRVQERIGERTQKLVERIKQRALKIIERFRHVIERLRRHARKIRELADRLAAERGVSIAPVITHLELAEEKIASAESKLGELEAAANAIDPATTTPATAVESIYGKFKGIHEDLVSARQHLLEALRTLNELRVSSRPTRTPRVTTIPTTIPTVAP